MLQIIKHKKEEIKEYCIYEIECSCGCKFKFDEAEVYEREKRLDGNWFIKCPECNEMLEFNPIEKQVYPAIKIIDKHIDKYEDEWFKECVEKWAKENLPSWIFLKPDEVEVNPLLHPNVKWDHDLTRTSYDPCRSCPNNPKNRQYELVGDSPCQWCSNNPARVTCIISGTSTPDNPTITGSAPYTDKLPEGTTRHYTAHPTEITTKTCAQDLKEYYNKK